MWPFLRKGNVKKKNEDVPAEECSMETAHCVWPPNIDTAEILTIKQPCTAADIYPLICDRNNIRIVGIAGKQYTSQEIRNTSFHERLGGSAGLPTDVLTQDPMPTGRAPQIIIDDFDDAVNPVPGHPDNPVTGIWHEPVTFSTDPTYERAIELLRQRNPFYVQFGDVPRTATEVPTPELEALNDALHFFPMYQPDPLLDTYDIPW